jgi:phage tail-like protein
MKLPRAPAAGLRLASPSAWQRCAFEACALVDDGVELMWQPWPAGTAPAAAPEAAAVTTGLAFDRLGRALRATAAGLETLPLAEQAPALSIAAAPPWTPLPHTPLAGCGAGAPADAPAPAAPAALATAAPDLLWVAEPAAARVWRYDLWARRYVGFHTLPGTPVALCSAGDDAVLALLRKADDSGGLVLLRACNPPQTLPWPAALREPAALARAADGRLWVLLQAGTPQARIVALGALPALTEGLALAVPGARAIAIGAALRDTPPSAQLSAPAERLFVAAEPGAPWAVFTPDGAADRPVIAPGWDGGAMGTAPDGRVGYVAHLQGQPELRFAAPTRLARALQGQVLSFRFDSEQPGAAWGRVWLEACLAPNTQLRLRCLVTDDDSPAFDETPRTPPDNLPTAPADDGHSPPLPEHDLWLALREQASRACIPSPSRGQRAGRAGWRPARAGHQWLQSWVGTEGNGELGGSPQAGDERGRGRYLWVAVELRGDGLRSPVLRALEVEQPGHAWLQQLPALFSREAQAASFLRRYLANPADLLGDLGVDADARHRLLAPGHAPAEMLGWLAALLGLALQPAWSERARRQLIAEAGAMAPRHGTPEVLRRIVEILAGVPVLLLEDFRLRHPGVVGGTASPAATSALGGGLRLGAALLPAPADGATAPEPVETGAWRFTLMLQGEVDAPLQAMLVDAVQRFKPAHTAFRLCALESGLRVGRGLHLDVAALVGPDSGLPLPVLGGTRLGRDAVLGRSAGEPGAGAGASASGAHPC